MDVKAFDLFTKNIWQLHSCTKIVHQTLKLLYVDVVWLSYEVIRGENQHKD